MVNTKELSVIKERMPPGTSEVKHFHNKARQFFYILKGTASFEIGESEQIVNQNEGIEIPPNIPHKIINNSENDLTFLVISQPESHSNRIDIE